MMSQDPWNDTHDALTSPAPDLSFQHGTSYDSYRKLERDESLSRPASLDLTIIRETYDTYDTELQQYPSTRRTDSGSQKLITSRMRRSSSVSSASSQSTVVRQHRTVRWLDFIEACIIAFWKIPVIRHILLPFQWISHAASRLMLNSRFHGWRMGILIGCMMSTLVLSANITVLVLGVTRGKGFQGGFAVPMSGLPSDMSWWSSAIHIGINALSMILLAASNYTMQVLSSPTREDIDRAHAKYTHLDVGILSTRNLGRIPKTRLALFLIMGVSTIPVHLFYNSAVFYIAANNEYNINVLQKDSQQYQDFLRNMSQTSPSGIDKNYKILQNDEWARTYDSDVVAYGDVYLVVDYYRSEINNKTLTGWPENWPNIPTEDFNTWSQGNMTYELKQILQKQNSKPDDIENLIKTASISREWIRFDTMASYPTLSKSATPYPKFAHVAYGYATRLDTLSRIQLSLVFLIIVIVCNSIKLLTMIWVLVAERKEYIVTLGDGVATFLEHPDPTTEGMCLLSRWDIGRKVCEVNVHMKHNDQLSKLATQNDGTWARRYTTYSNALNKDRQVGSYFIFIVVGILFAAFLACITTIGNTSTKWGTKSNIAFREADSSSPQTLLNAWIANAPQLVLSFCYLAINAECTAMAGAAEWNNLATTHKGLRVTRPRGQQRDTYFLQLPYKWSLPLNLASGGLHWLLSQSVFLVRIDTYDRQGKLIDDESTSACGFSGTSWIAMSVSFLLLVGIVGLIGRKKIRVRIPFAAGSSLVISAACQPGKGEVNPQMRPVRWGVTQDRMFDGEKHCSLSAKDVEAPKVGGKYL